MFQQKDIEEYQNITAPTELKDRVRFSVMKKQNAMRKQRIAVTAVAAGLALFLISGSLLGNSSTILSVNDVVVTREALWIENQDAVVLAASAGQQRSLPVHIPMEIFVDGNAQVEVNVGTLMQVIDENQYTAEAASIEISKSAQIYWILDGNFIQENPICTITNGWKKNQYMVEYQAETGACSIKRVK